jgi:hypothetical protein
MWRPATPDHHNHDRNNDDARNAAAGFHDDSDDADTKHPVVRAVQRSKPKFRSLEV